MRATTAMIFAHSRVAANSRVLRNRLTPCTRARALGRPKREEKPAASTIICSLNEDETRIGYYAQMKGERASLQHRPFLIPIWLTAIAAIAATVVFGLAVFAAWTWVTANSTTVIVIRHAEKDTVSAADPALSAAG